MENAVSIECRHCGARSQACVPEAADEHEIVFCAACGKPTATVGQLHAIVAQEALGLGATELRDDHIPVDGELGERPGV